MPDKKGNVTCYHLSEHPYIIPDFKGKHIFSKGLKLEISSSREPLKRETDLNNACHLGP